MATYYVAEGGTAANKAAATGDGDASTFMSVTRHNDDETFSGLDIIVLSSYGGAITDIVIPPSSGSAGSPITYRGDGSTVLDGEDTQTHIFQTDAKSYLTIEDFTAIDCTDSNLWISRGSNVIIQDITAYGGQTIRTNSVDDLIVRRCEVYNSDYNGIYIGSTNYAGADVAGALVEDCYVHDCDHNGIDVHVNSFGANMSDITVRRCWTESNANNGIYCTNGPNEDNRLSDIKIYNNVSCNNTLAGINPNYLGAGDLIIYTVKVYNNTVYGNGTWGINVWATDGDIYNNVVIAESGSGIKGNSNGDASMLADYNICYDSSGDASGFISWEGVNRTHAAWVSTDGQNANGSFENPDLTDAAGGDFTLTAASPCVDTGVNLGSPYNTALLPGSTWPDGVLTADQDDY